MAVQLTAKNGTVLYEAKTGERVARFGKKAASSISKRTVVTEKKTSGGGTIQAVGEIPAANLQYVETVPIPSAFYGMEVAATPTRLEYQLFVITDVEENEDYITVTAEHVWYGLRDIPTSWKGQDNTSYSAAAVINNVMGSALSSVSAYDCATDCLDTLQGKELDYENRNLAMAFLDPEEGICARFGLSLIRNNWDFYCLKNVGYDRGFSVEYGKNMLSVKRSEDIEETYTRIIPWGIDGNGNVRYMNGTRYIDSTHINDYPAPRCMILDTGLVVGQDGVTDANISTKLQQAAQAELAKGVDLPNVRMVVDFLSVGDTEEYAQLKDLDKVYLYDIVTVRDKVRGYNYSAQVVGVKHNILTGRLEAVTLGSVSNASAVRKIATWQVPTVDGGNIRLKSILSTSIGDGAITESKIEDGAVTRAKIALLAIGEAQIDNAAITEAKIADAAIGSAKIAEAAVTSAKIEDLAVTSGKIANAAVTSAKIGDAQITTAKIENLAVTDGKIANAAITTAKIANAAVQEAQLDSAAVTTAKIANGAITTAKIGDAQITGAKIANAAIGTAQIADAAITSAKIVSVNADTITAGTLATERLLITGEDGIVYEINAESGSLTTEQLAEDKYKEQLSGTVLVAKSVTADQIAAQTITGAEVAAGTLSTNHVEAGFGAGLDISSNESVTQIVGKVNENWTSVQTTMTGIRADVHTLETAVGENTAVAQNVNNWMTFDSNGLVIGKSGTNFNLQMTNEKLALRDADTDIVWISNNEANIRNLHAENSFSINGYTFEDTGVALVLR